MIRHNRVLRNRQQERQMDKVLSNYFDHLEKYMGFIVPDWFVNGTLRFIFSKTSVIIHTIWFVYWGMKHLDISLLTNIVSLEAIYIGILIGIQQLRHHLVLKGRVKPDGKVVAKVHEVKK